VHVDDQEHAGEPCGTHPTRHSPEVRAQVQPDLGVDQHLLLGGHHPVGSAPLRG
jgi:hypothetical protein